MEVWELKPYFYPCAGGLKKKEEQKNGATSPCQLPLLVRVLSTTADLNPHDLLPPAGAGVLRHLPSTDIELSHIERVLTNLPGT